MSEKERADDKQPPWEQGDSDAEGFGTWLRQQREVREISLREIAEATKISLRYLEAMEEDRFDLLPAAVFAKGFLRQYARYVGLDSDEVVNRYLSARQMEPDSSSSGDTADVSESYSSRSSRPSGPARGGSGASTLNWTVILIALAVLALLAAAVFWLPGVLGGGEESPDDLPSGVASSAPGDDDGDLASSQEADDDEPAPPVAPLVVEVQFEDDCWVRATVDGEIVEDVTKVQGEALQLTADESVELRLGAPSAVSLIEVNGESYDFDRESEGAIDLSFTAPESDLDDEGAAAAA